MQVQLNLLWMSTLMTLHRSNLRRTIMELPLMPLIDDLDVIINMKDCCCMRHLESHFAMIYALVHIDLNVHCSLIPILLHPPPHLRIFSMVLSQPRTLHRHRLPYNKNYCNIFYELHSSTVHNVHTPNELAGRLRIDSCRCIQSEMVNRIPYHCINVVRPSSISSIEGKR